MRALNEQTILITGATDGLGRRIAADLAGYGARVLVHGRNQEKLDETLAEVPGGVGYLADLSSLAETRRLADEVAAAHERLDVLVNNAGVGFGAPGAARQESADGYELRFAVNYLAPFLLTRQLLPLLEKSAPARVVNVASVGQAPIDFDDIMMERSYEGVQAYRQSKLAQIMFTFDLAARLEGTGVTVNAVHPASLMPTQMVIEARTHTISTVEEGAASVERLIADPELEDVSGVYFDQLDEGRALPQAYEMETRARLWRLSEQLVDRALR
jgi:NAD(P)-dependent dehydrogenase (short-subunit alcohol dehydrogenase family)